MNPYRVDKAMVAVHKPTEHSGLSICSGLQLFFFFFHHNFQRLKFYYSGPAPAQGI